MAIDYSGMEKEQLIKLLNKLETRAGYGILFEPQKEDFLDEMENCTPLLKQIPEKGIEGEGPEHILIEGENYHALKILNYTHKSAIDLIYIDPPYNTGSNDFMFNDSFLHADDSFRHSKWLSFMSRRLKLAKKLLKQDGAIVISIDENEFAQVKLLCDNVFGENNFVECIPWKKKPPKGAQTTSMMAGCHEYLLVYQRSNKFKFIGVPRKLEDFPHDDDNGYGPYANGTQNLVNSTKSKDQAWTITNPETGLSYTDTWGHSRETMMKFIKDGIVIWPDEKGKREQVRRKDYMWMKKSQYIQLSSEWISKREERSETWPHVEESTKMFKSMVPDEQFQNPKPIKLMEYLISVACGKDAVILDFFAGSGTTGHAVMNLNAADGGTRRCILCTNNENEIAERITYPRLVAAINGWQQERKKGSPIDVPGTGAALVYFKIDYILKLEVQDETYRSLQYRTGAVTRLKNHTFTRLYLDLDDPELQPNFLVASGITESNAPVYSVIVYDDEFIEKAVDWCHEQGITENVHFFVFSYGMFAFEDDFPETKLEFTVEAHPDAYLVSLEAADKIGV